MNIKTIIIIFAVLAVVVWIGTIIAGGKIIKIYGGLPV